MSLTYDLHEHTFSASAVKLTIKDLLPGAEVQLAFCDRDDDLAAHYLSLDVSVGVVFSRFVVVITTNRFMWRDLLEPRFIVAMQPAFIVVNEHRRRDVHRIHQHQTLLNTALSQTLLNLRRDVDKRSPARHVEPQFF